MAYLLKQAYNNYFYLMNEVSDPRSKELWIAASPVPILVLVYVWYQFVLSWGPKFMENRRPLEIKPLMIVYNIVQVMGNAYILYYLFLSINEIDWSCAEIDFSEDYWPKMHFKLTYLYFLIKILDLMDTIFFVLRKKSAHISFLHVYHHAMMVIVGWVALKYLGGGHSYFLGLANCSVHIILYLYYLLTAYDSKFGQIIWIKKFITQMQLTQFAFLFWSYTKLLFKPDCNYPLLAVYLLIPQNCFMVILFSDFYIRTYILAPRRKKLLEEAQQNNEKDIQS
ncbi:hypothetical protein ABEB36_011640 [Hypothenemus hampei]|uniref:Elongation of very long chain fatty acids protein n=1 Tax=Hypothenemus hampei TaxID=57062 RepID=A0ABD1E8H7_HYPHA